MEFLSLIIYHARVITLDQFFSNRIYRNTLRLIIDKEVTLYVLVNKRDKCMNCDCKIKDMVLVLRVLNYAGRWNTSRQIVTCRFLKESKSFKRV
jgi:thiamine kinase-like enzyme